MAKNFEHIIHKNSSALVDDNPKLPTSGQLEYGEIAVNYAKDKETISLKNSNNEIVTFTSDKKLDNYVTVSDFDEAMQVASAALNDLEATKLEKSDFDKAMENLETQFSNFYTKQEIDDDSLVVASALNDLEEKKLDKLDFNEMLEGLETQLSDFYTKEEIDNAELVTSSALNDLNERIGSVENAFKELDNYFDENELIVSTALNNLEESKADKDDLTDLINNVYTKEEINNDHLVISSSLNDLNTRLNTKQDTLVSGTTIKTINNQSILGSGNITLTGGSGSGGGGDINVIESVKVNGSALTPDANKAVNITAVPASIVTQNTTHRFVSDTEKSTWDNKVSNVQADWNATSGLAQILNKPTIPVAVTESIVSGWGFTKNTGTVTGVKMNGTTKNPTSGVVDLGTVITSHQDISGKADKSAAIGSLSLSLDSTNYKITLSGTKVDGTTFTVSDVIDLPLESVVVNGSYNNTTKKVVLTLQSGSTVEFSVADLVSGLQSEITSTNKLSADLIADGTTNKVVTASEKTTWNGKQDALTNANVLTGITSTKVSNWDNAATNSHTHSNKSVLDGISSTDITNWNSKTDNVGTVTGVKMNGTTNNPTNGVVDLGSVITSETTLSKGSTSGSGNAVTDISVSGHQITLTKGKTFLESETQLSKGTTTGTGNAVTDITVSGHQITLTKGTTFLTQHQSIKTLNGTALTGTGNITLRGVPAFSASDNGKILGVVNGQLAWITPTTIYTGSGTPSSSTGNDGDIYLQTS